jgi:hypothetical protein
MEQQPIATVAVEVTIDNSSLWKIFAVLLSSIVIGGIIHSLTNRL